MQHQQQMEAMQENSSRRIVCQPDNQANEKRMPSWQTAVGKLERAIINGTIAGALLITVGRVSAAWGHENRIVSDGGRQSTKQVQSKNVQRLNAVSQQIHKSCSRTLEYAVTDPMAIHLHYIQEGMQDLRAGHCPSRQFESNFNEVINDFFKAAKMPFIRGKNSATCALDQIARMLVS